MNDWEAAKPYLRAALDRLPTHSLSDVRADILDRRAQLWFFGDAAVVTQVCEYPKMRTLRVWLAGGNLDTLRRAMPALDDAAREFGCKRIEVDGRKGWSRIMTDYYVERVVLTKEVD